MLAFALQGSMENRSQAAGPAGSGVSVELMFTLNTADRHSVAIIANDSLPNISAAHPVMENATAQNAKAIVPATKPEGSLVKPVAAQLSMFSSEEPHANPSQSLDSERDWLIRVATSCLPTLRLLTAIGPSGWFGKTSPVYCHQTEDGILEPSSEGWGNSGMGSPTEFWTLSTSEWTPIPELFPSDDGVCSLSDILETGILPQRYFLSAKACAGILRRAEKRGKNLPEALERALQAAAGSPLILNALEDSK